MYYIFWYYYSRNLRVGLSGNYGKVLALLMLLMTTIIPSFLAILGLLDILKIHVTRINPLAIGTIIVLIFVTILVVNLKYFLDERRYQNNKLLPRKVLFIYLFVTFLLFVAGTLSYIA